MKSDSSRSSSNDLIFLIIVSIPFIQLGIEYYISVFFLVFNVLLMLSLNRVTNKSANFLFVGCSVFLLKFFVLGFNSADSRSLLIPLREMSCFVGLILISNKLRYSDYNKFHLYFKLMLILILLVVIYQYFQIKNGQYFGFPVKYYVKNKLTLEGAELALYHGTRFRPTAFYGEPSYTSWVTLTLLAVLLKISTFKTSVIYIFISLFIVSISQSLAGILSIVLFSTYWILFKSQYNIAGSRVHIRKIPFSLIISVVIVFFIFVISFFVFSEEFSNRLSKVLLNKDESSSFRINYAFTYFYNSFSNGAIFGVNNMSTLWIDNAAVSLLIQYGILSFILFGVIYFFVNNNIVRLYIVMSLFFNGAFFSYDKIILLSLVFGVYSNEKVKYILQKKKNSAILQ